MQCEAFPPPFHPTALIIARCHLQPSFVIGLLRSCHNYQGLPFSNSAFYRPADGPICSKWNQELPLTTFTLSPKLFASFFFCQILVCIVCAKNQFPFYKDFVLFYLVTIEPEIWFLIGEEYIIIVSSCSDHEWQGIVGKTQKIAAPFCWLNYRPESDHFNHHQRCATARWKTLTQTSPAQEDSADHGLPIWPFSLYSLAAAPSIGKQCDFCQCYSLQY